MGRCKARWPKRLHYAAPILALSAFEVRLTQGAAGVGGAGVFGSDVGDAVADAMGPSSDLHDGEVNSNEEDMRFGARVHGGKVKRWWLVGDDEVDEEIGARGAHENGEAAKAEPSNAVFFEHLAGFSKWLRGENNEYTALRLAEVELSFWSADKEAADGSGKTEAPSDLVEHRHEVVADWSCDNIWLQLEREQGQSCMLVVWRRQNQENPPLLLFRGLASYWMGASEEQLQALGKAAGDDVRERGRNAHTAWAPFLVPCSIVYQQGAKPRLKYAVCVSKKACCRGLREALWSLPPGGEQPNFACKSVSIVMEWLFPGVISKSVAQPTHFLSLDRRRYVKQFQELRGHADPMSLFTRVKPSTRRQMLANTQVPAELTAKLRPYQSRAVRWMLEQESVYGDSPASGFAIAASVFVNYLGSDGQPFQYCPFNGAIVMLDGNKEYVKEDEAPLLGGILADEMGLGKTVEVISMILANRHPATGDVTRNVSALDPMRSLDMSKEMAMTQHCEAVACVCNHPDHELPGGWVQCCSCGTWQHAICTGFFLPSDIDSSTVSAGSGDGCGAGGDTSVQRENDTICASADNNAFPNATASTQPPESFSSISEHISETNSAQHVCLSCRANCVGSATEFSGATLIICPRSICAQWKSEILKHTEPGSVKVLIYNGVKAIMESCGKALAVLIKALQKSSCKRRAFGNPELLALRRAVEEYHSFARQLWPQWLSGFDVVLTTYEVLRSDIHHVDTHERQRGDRRFALRKAKRYWSPPSPLGSTLWRRVCLDEAQEVENSTVAAAEVALSLRTMYRWAITGTPVGRHGLEDLFGLLLFIGVVPFGNHAWWRKALVQPLEYGHKSALKRFETVFKKVMWRNTKRDIKDELGLPSLTEHIHRLQFTPIEQHFYSRQHQEVQRIMLEAVANGNGTTDASSSDGLFGPLLRLRQACCHPQVGARGIVSQQQGGMQSRRGRRRGRGRNKRQRTIDKNDGAGAKILEKGSSVTAPMAMSEVHSLLVNNAKVECEEAQRLLFMNMNAVAALLLAMELPREAKQVYMEILDLAKTHEGTIKTDSLQKLHTLEGLKCTLQSNSADDTPAKSTASAEPTAVSSSNAASSSGSNNILMKQLHIDRVCMQIARIRQGHLLAYETKVAAVVAAFETRSAQVEAPNPPPLPYSGLAHAEDWWMLAIQAIGSAHDGPRREALLVDRIKMDLGGSNSNSSSSNATSSIGQFTNLYGLRMVLERELAKISKAVRETIKTVALLAKPPTEAEIMEASECQLCRSYFDKTGPACANCRRRPALTRLQKLIFEERSERKRQRDENPFSGGDDGVNEDEDNYTYRRPCDSRVILRLLKTAVKSVPAPSGDNSTHALVKAADLHFEHFERVEVLLKSAWAVWGKRDQQLKACDDLSQASMRMRVQLPGEEIAKGEEQWKVRSEEAHARLQGYELDSARARSQLRQCISQLRYLDTIKDNSGDSSSARVLGAMTMSTNADGGTDNQMCPVCHDEFTDNIAVLLCGHAFCVDCVGKLKRWSRRCPSCRAKFTASDVRYVTTNETVKETTESSESLTSSSSSSSSSSPRNAAAPTSTAESAAATKIIVKGNLGTKLDAVLHEVLSLEMKCPSAKCLIFSQWEEVLNILEHGLLINDVSHVRLKGYAKYDQKLSLFRADPSVRALLLPLKSGCKGLNLTEASHVFFAEPICNAAIQAQAIGRVHRMGQRSRVHVHHFVVGNTIEAKIYRMFRKKRLDQIGESVKNDAENAQQLNSNKLSTDLTGAQTVTVATGADVNDDDVVVENRSTTIGGDMDKGDAYATDNITATETEQLSIAEIRTLLG